jgi:hypothetical protein
VGPRTVRCNSLDSIPRQEERGQRAGLGKMRRLGRRRSRGVESNLFLRYGCAG